MADLFELARGLAQAIGVAAPPRALVDFDRLVMHPSLTGASRSLFASGHYANAVEDGGKALIAHVRQRSGATADGVLLMEYVFSPKNPVLQVNLGKTRPDQDERDGYFLLFKGAVQLARNPRSHDHTRTLRPDEALAILCFLDHLFHIADQALVAPRSP